MSSNPVSRAEFEQVVAELADLRLQVRELRAAVHHEGSQDFEVVSSAASAGTSSPVLSASLAAGTDLPPARVEAAQQVGRWLRRGLNQEHRGLSGREKIDLASKVYIVVKDISGTVFDPPKILSSWANTKLLVSVDKQLGDSLFVGLPSKSEARIALSAAGLKIPDALTRHS